MPGPVLSTDPNTQANAPAASPASGAGSPTPTSVPVFVSTTPGASAPPQPSAAPASPGVGAGNAAMAAANAYSADLCNQTMKVTFSVPVQSGLRALQPAQYKIWEESYKTTATDGSAITLHTLRHNPDGSPNCTTILGKDTSDPQNLKGVLGAYGQNSGLVTAVQMGLNEIGKRQNPAVGSIPVTGTIDDATLSRLEKFAKAEGVTYRGGYDGPLSHAVERAYVKYGVLN